MSERDEVEQLLAVLAKLTTLLRENSQQFWADWIDKDVRWLTAGDAYGLDHLLQAFGGMGSLNDVYFHPYNKNASTEEQAEELNREFSSLKSEAYSLARTLQREVDRTPPEAPA